MTLEKKKNQRLITLEALKEAPATSMMLAKRTGILRANLTRYLAKLEEEGKIAVVKEAPCSVTGHFAKYYSAKPEHLPKKQQVGLFPPQNWGV